ncbi:hypothetical protein CYY_004648 [Polysphondylium violaceum]|uniref:NIF3-like protein 1 n=1 Tax=Polysphondylium violaceum TaxID=133409 RepID=A0A8J4PXR0_9MYCE|nr:hypothetical protein CYY_004648 [Polysphondylium violaceum]
MKCKNVLSLLNQKVPLSLAEKWDNVGLLVEPSNTDELEVSNIFLTNDLTEPVLQEAIEKKANFIISYHPPLFNQFKTVNQKSVSQRIAIKAIENRIPIYSPHSALDSVQGGINDWIANGLLSLTNGKGHSRPIQSTQEAVSKSSHKITVYSNATDSLLSEFAKLVDQHFTISSSVTHLFCNANQLANICNFLKQETQQGNVQHWDITNLEKSPSNVKGQGRLVTLDSPVEIDQVVTCIKQLFELDKVRIGKPLIADPSSKKIQTISLCAGSGGFLILNEKADLYLTGELKHHEILDACAKGNYVLVCDHSNSERGYLKVFKKDLEQLFNNNINIIISEKDTDPLEIV